jgi:hypothetical protein
VFLINLNISINIFPISTGDSPPCPPIGFSLHYRSVERLYSFPHIHKSQVNHPPNNFQVPPGCGGEILPDPLTGQLSGILQSPNFPHNYFPNLDCLWVLRVRNETKTIISGENGTALIGMNGEAVEEDDDPFLAEQKVEILFEQFDVPPTVTQASLDYLFYIWF